MVVIYIHTGTAQWKSYPHQNGLMVEKYTLELERSFVTKPELLSPAIL
jgi:hypothetical protein